MSIVQVRGLLDAVEEAGASGAKILKSVGFDPARVNVADGWASVEEFDRLVDAAIDVTGDPAFGIHWGETTSGVRYGVLAPLLGTSRTLRVAFEAMARYQRIISECDEVEIVDSNEGIELRWTAPATAPDAARTRKELAVVGFVRLLRHFHGRDGVPRLVAFDYAPPAYAGEYARIFEGRERFRQSWCGVDVPADLLDAPQPGWNEELYRAMLGHADVALANVEGTMSQRERVAQTLGRAFPRWLDMSETAQELGLSERTLRRHLSREGVTFAEVLADTQKEIAIRLLRDPGRTIQQVAYDMGFASASAFNRAFKRWTGQSPSEVRKAIGNAPR